MIIQQFELFFHKQYATYFGGEIVTGNLVAKTLLPTRIKGIEINFHGEARVEWSESRQERDADGNMQHINDLYNSNELYFDNNYYILGGPMCDMLMQPGDHMHNFSMQLPSILPSSFEGKYGCVRYSVTATLMCLGQNSHQCRAFFTVINQLDLNRVVAIKDPVQVVKDKYLCCCCCKSGPISAVVSLPASGFVPGQYIPFTVEVDNITNKALSTVICTLQKVVIFTTVRPTKKSRADAEKVCQMVLGGVGPNDSCTWSERMAVPSLPPSNLQHCSIIDINYILEVEVKIPGPHQNLSVSIPITIGTIPFNNYMPQPQHQQGALPTAPPMPTELPPPTYEQCKFGRGDALGGGQNAGGGAVFQPRYPTYHF